MREVNSRSSANKDIDTTVIVMMKQHTRWVLIIKAYQDSR